MSDILDWFRISDIGGCLSGLPISYSDDSLFAAVCASNFLCVLSISTALRSLTHSDSLLAFERTY